MSQPIHLVVVALIVLIENTTCQSIQDRYDQLITYTKDEFIELIKEHNWETLGLFV